MLSDKQKQEVTSGIYRALKVHPTQLYSAAASAILSLILCLFWRWGMKTEKIGKFTPVPGCTFALMFILYGITRFFIEFLRDDNPFEYAWWAIYRGGTISQNLGIYMTFLGIILMIIFKKAKPDSITLNHLQEVTNPA
jgi:prolipoprotein diacylglyceryltransferase